MQRALCDAHFVLVEDAYLRDALSLASHRKQSLHESSNTRDTLDAVMYRCRVYTCDVISLLHMTATHVVLSKVPGDI